MLDIGATLQNGCPLLIQTIVAEGNNLFQPDPGTQPSKRSALNSPGAEPARTLDTLWRRIGIILDTFTAKDCANYFQAAGYQHSMGKCSNR